MNDFIRQKTAMKIQQWTQQYIWHGKLHIPIKQDHNSGWKGLLDCKKFSPIFHLSCSYFILWMLPHCEVWFYSLKAAPYSYTKDTSAPSWVSSSSSAFSHSCSNCISGPGLNPRRFHNLFWHWHQLISI